LSKARPRSILYLPGPEKEKSKFALVGAALLGIPALVSFSDAAAQ
jgi:hypothetical protein